MNNQKTFIEKYLDHLINVIERYKKKEKVTWGFANWKRSIHGLEQPSNVDRLKRIFTLIFC